MKHFSLIALLFILSNFPSWVQAQAPYTGGTHDGYAKYSLAVTGGSGFATEQISVTPNPVQAGNRLQIRLTEVYNKVDIRLNTVLGQQLQREVTWGVAGSYSTTLATDDLPDGIYLLNVIVDGKSYPQKIVVTAP